MKTSGIYLITNQTNHKIYVGSSTFCERRRIEHKGKLNKNKHPNPHLQAAWSKYGELSFRFDIVEEIPIEQLQFVEQQYLDWIGVMPKQWFYNISNNSEAPARGIKKPEGFGEKMSKLLKGRKCSREHRDNISKGHMGIKHSKEWCDNQSKSMKGIPKSKEHIEKMRLSQLGKVISIETRSKISKSNTGKPPTNLDPTIYTLNNTITGETFSGVKRDFYKKYNLDKGSVNELIGKSTRRTVKSVKGWILVNPPLASTILS